MTAGDPLQRLADADLRALAAALSGGRLSNPYTAIGVGRVVGPAMAAVVAARLSELAGSGMSSAHAAQLIEAILTARASRPERDDAAELVWTGPEATGSANRATAVVVRELFAQALDSVLVAGFAVHRGRAVFRGLAERMSARPTLRVKLFLDVRRARHDSSPDADVVARFAKRFLERDWPEGFPLPAVFYDPRSLVRSEDVGSCLHAKCVVVDRRVALVTSANFTEAAQERNIEAGAVVRSTRFAGKLADQFETLATSGLLRAIPLPPRRLA